MLALERVVPKPIFRDQHSQSITKFLKNLNTTGIFGSDPTQVKRGGMGSFFAPVVTILLLPLSAICTDMTNHSGSSSLLKSVQSMSPSLFT